MADKKNLRKEYDKFIKQGGFGAALAKELKKKGIETKKYKEGTDKVLEVQPKKKKK